MHAEKSTPRSHTSSCSLFLDVYDSVMACRRTISHTDAIARCIALPPSPASLHFQPTVAQLPSLPSSKHMPAGQAQQALPKHSSTVCIASMHCMSGIHTCSQGLAAHLSQHVLQPARTLRTLCQVCTACCSASSKAYGKSELVAYCSACLLVCGALCVLCISLCTSWGANEIRAVLLSFHDLH